MKTKNKQKKYSSGNKPLLYRGELIKILKSMPTAELETIVKNKHVDIPLRRAYILAKRELRSRQ